MITCAHCGHEFSSALAACPVCHIPVNGIPQWLFRGKSAPASGERGAQSPVTAIDVAATATAAGLPPSAPPAGPVAVPSHRATQPELETPGEAPPDTPGRAVDAWAPLGTALGLDRAAGSAPDSPGTGDEPTGAAPDVAVPPAPNPPRPIESPTAFAPLAAPAAPTQSPSPPSAAVTPGAYHLEPTVPARQPGSPAETPVSSHAEVAHLFAAGSNNAEPSPLQPPDEATPHVRPLDTFGRADVAVEVEPPSFDLEPPPFPTDPSPLFAAPSAPAPSPTSAAEEGETTLRLSEILPDSQRRGSALFGIGDDSTAQLSKELLNSASLLRAPLDQPVNTSPPVWQQPMGAPLTTGISSSVSPSLGSSFQPGPPDSLFEGRPAPSVADVAAAAAASQGFAAAGGDPRPGIDPFSPAGPPPGPAQPVTGTGFDPSALGGAAADGTPGVASSAGVPFYPDYPHHTDSSASGAAAPADASPAWDQPVISEGALLAQAGRSESPRPRAEADRSARRPPQGKSSRGSVRASHIVGGAAIVIGVALVALLLWYLLSQMLPNPQTTPTPTPTAVSTPTTAPTETAVATPTETPPQTEAPPAPQRAAGALPADTIKVCEDNAVGVMGPGLSCDVAKTVATTIPANAAGDFTINAYIVVLGRNGDFACSTLDTYYQCTLTSTGAVYRIAFGREGR